MSAITERILKGDSIRESVLSESKFKGSGNRIEFEDQLVIVYDKKGNEIYRGLEDYEPMKYEDWKFDSSIGAYRFKDFIKDCVG